MKACVNGEYEAKESYFFDESFYILGPIEVSSKAVSNGALVFTVFTMKVVSATFC